MIQFSSQCTPQFNEGVTKFQSACRGYVSRKYTIFPSPSLNSSICNQVNDFIKSNKRKIDNVTSEINKGKKFFIKWDKNREEISLLFPREEAVGSGFWKKFFASNTIKIPLTPQKKEIREFESVWIEADNKTAHEVRIQEFLYKQFIKEMPMGVYFLEPWEQIHQNIYTQRRLTNRLDGTKFDDPFQKAHCIRDMARNLVWMHKQRMIHGDVSLKNILVEERIDDEGFPRLVSYLTDFGSTKTWGANQDRKLDDYVRWDPCKCFADINTPLMDWYGFVVTNILAWFPEMAIHLKWENFISTRQKVFDHESRGDFVSDAFYWTGPKPFNDLTFEEQQAWHLLISICRKSAQLYLYFKESLGEISKEEVEQGMIEIKASEVIEECLQFADAMCEKVKLSDFL